LRSPLSVNELNNQINGTLETTFASVYVNGEISNLTYHSSGHIYFSIKDDKSTISCVMFKGNASYLKFRLIAGMKITISGNITVYVPRGTYQLLCTKIEPSGIGELSLAYEQLKTKLQIKGYFDKSIKKQLPLYPKNIYVITSRTGAAIEDMKKILANRYSLAKMILVPTLVQGIGAKEDIERNIKFADNLAQKQKDSIIIVGRGGGSIEDLWAFNEEIVADAIFNAVAPVISAVGHESDFVISDFVADIRASTPSNAIEISTPNMNDLMIFIDTLRDYFDNKIKTNFTNKVSELNNVKLLFTQHSFVNRFKNIDEALVSIKQQFILRERQVLNNCQKRLDFVMESFSSNHPDKKISNGLVQVTKDNKIINIDNCEVKENITLETAKYKYDCKILEKTLNY